MSYFYVAPVALSITGASINAIPSKILISKNASENAIVCASRIIIWLSNFAAASNPVALLLSPWINIEALLAINSSTVCGTDTIFSPILFVATGNVLLKTVLVSEVQSKTLGSVIQIAHRLGYASAESFGNMFKRKTDFSPGKYSILMS